MAGGLKGLGEYLKGLSGEAGDALKSLYDMKFIQEVFFDVDEKATNIAKKFGQGRENILAIKQSMSDAYQDVAKMGGSFENINTIQTDIADKLNRNVILSSDSYKEFYAMQEVTSQSIGTITEKFKDAGFSIYQSGAEMQKVVDTARELGVSVSKVSSEVLVNMDYINKYNFEGGVEGLAKMAAQAATLRINMQQTLAFADKVYNPEGAIQTAAALQRLGVTQAQLLDPLRLMNLAQNDPTELQNQIVEMTKKFVQLGKAGNFEIMPGGKRRLQEIAKEMSIPYEQLTKMALGSFELEEKMKKIKFPEGDQFASKETRQLIANLAEKGKDGEYRVKITDEKGKTMEKSITELSSEDIEKLKAPPKKMEELAVDQLSVLKSINASLDAMAGGTAYAFAGSKTAEDVMQAEVQMYKKMSDTFVKTFDSKEIRTSLDTGLGKMFDSILDKDYAKAFKESTQGLYDYFLGLSNTFTDEAAKNWDELINSDNSIIKVMRQLGASFKALGDEGVDLLTEKIKKAKEGEEITQTRPPLYGTQTRPPLYGPGPIIYSPPPPSPTPLPQLPDPTSATQNTNQNLTQTQTPDMNIVVKVQTETMDKKVLENVMREVLLTIKNANELKKMMIDMEGPNGIVTESEKNKKRKKGFFNRDKK